ncbi:MAG: hypothetical protein ABIY55_08155 [Kofleriaceae bacterium]
MWMQVGGGDAAESWPIRCRTLDPGSVWSPGGCRPFGRIVTVTARHAVEPARDAATDVEQRGNGVVVEHGLAASAGDVGPQRMQSRATVERERRESSDGGDALVEGVVGGLGQSVVEHGVAREDETDGALAIEVGNREQADVLERVVRHDVGLVDDGEDLTTIKFGARVAFDLDL